MRFNSLATFVRLQEKHSLPASEAARMARQELQNQENDELLDLVLERPPCVGGESCVLTDLNKHRASHTNPLLGAP